jgi:ubiquinone/menaquinone biosynthesis C-methylase UbiE
VSDAVDFHSRIAACFDRAYAISPTFRERLGVWARLIGRYRKPGMRVLDAGCGSGAITAQVTDLASVVLAFDGSAAMIALAQARELPNVQFTVARLETIDFGGQEFDLVLASSLLEYCCPFWPAFDRLARSLAPAGTLLVSLPNDQCFYRKGENFVFRLTRRPRYRAHTHPVPNRDEFEKGLTERGLRIVEVQSYGAAARLPGWLRRLPPARLANTLTVFAIQHIV